MRTIIIILTALISVKLSAQVQVTDKYLMPKNDTMDVIRIKFVDVGKYTMNVGQYSRIEPVVVDTLLPKGAHFLPKRCLYDPDMASVKGLLNGESKEYLKLSTKKLIPIEVHIIDIGL